MKNSAHYYETPWLTLADAYGCGEDWANGPDYYVCRSAINREFEIPKRVKRIKLCIRRGFVDSAVHAEFNPCDMFYALFFKLSNRFAFREPISWWVEYEVQR